MKKNNIILYLVIALCVIVVVGFCVFLFINRDEPLTDAERFKQEFEMYNGLVYDDLKEDLTSSLSKLTNIEYESVDLTDIEIDEDGLLSLSVRAEFKYTISYEENGETKTKSTDDNDTMYLTYGYQDGSYKIVDASSLQTYFSKYF